MSLHELTLEGAQAALSSGRTTAVELVRATLGRIEALNPTLNAFLRVDEAGALADAQASDLRRKNGGVLGALDGVPVGLKDLICTKGLETTAASAMLAGWKPPYDATVVGKLREAGAIVLGKLNLDEFAMGSSNETSAFGAAKNPWDTSRTPGGSSGGSAAAVAGRLCPVALGTDTGGSIRQPAAFTGLVGLKPTYGRVSRHGVIAFASSLDQVGPMGRTVRDAAIVFEAIAGHDVNDATSLATPVTPVLSDIENGVKGLRVGLVAGMRDGVAPEVAQAVDEAVRTYERLGATVHEVALPHARYAIAAYYLIATAEASSNLARYDGVRYGHRAAGAKSLVDVYLDSRAEGFGDEVKRRVMLGTHALSAGYYDAYYLKAQKVRSLIRRDFDEAFGGVDVILSPVTPTTAFKLGERIDDPLQMYLGDLFTIPANLAGLPALSVPCGFTATGLPIGLQLTARALDEAVLLRSARAYERETDWHKRAPELG